MARMLAGLSGHIVGQCAEMLLSVGGRKPGIQRLLSGQKAENIGGFDQEEHFLFVPQ